MSRKLKNTIVLLIIFLLVTGSGGVYSFVLQNDDITSNAKRIDELQQFSKNRESLMSEISPLETEVAKLDSVLNKMEYNIPANLSQYSFYDFIIEKTADFSQRSHVNITFLDRTQNKDYSFYNYLISGDAYYNDLYKLIFSIENSKAIKKVSNVSMNSIVTVDDEEYPRYLVNFKFNVKVFTANTDRFVSTDFVEKDLFAPRLYDLFYPLIRDKVVPNLDKRLDVQTARLLAILPNGVYMTDASDRTYMLNKGDKVYLGYLTRINRERGEVTFVINNGGIIEYPKLSLNEEEENEHK